MTQMMIEKETMDVDAAKKAIEQKLNPDYEGEDEYIPRFEIRERTLGLANPKIIPLNKENLKEIIIGIYSLEEIKAIEKEKRERKGK